MYFSIATPSMKALISFRPGVNIKTNSIKLSHKQSLEKLTSHNEVCFSNKGFVWDANMTISLFALLFSCLRMVGMGITPSKVLVVYCKGKFFLHLSF